MERSYKIFNEAQICLCLLGLDCLSPQLNGICTVLIFYNNNNKKYYETNKKIRPKTNTYRRGK
jgi:hypothetical protein